MSLIGRISVVAMLLALAPAGPLPARAESSEWKPMLKDKKGNLSELPDQVEQLKDKDWREIDYTEFAGYKPTLGVVESEGHVEGAQSYSNEWVRFFSSLQANQGASGTNNVESLVRQALSSTHRFTMVERTSALGDVTDEQDMGASGRVDQKSAARIGRLRGSEFVVKVEIIEINPEKESRNINALGGGMGAHSFGIGSLGLSGKVAFARINVRVINSTTGVVVKDLTVDGTDKSSSLNLAGGLLKVSSSGIGGGKAGMDSKKAALLSNALQAAANKAAYWTALSLQDEPWTGSVASVNGTTLHIAGGRNVGLSEGMTLELLTKGEEIKDPDTGELLGSETTANGKVKVVEVADRFATCEIIEGGQDVKKGDLVRLNRKRQKTGD